MLRFKTLSITPPNSVYVEPSTGYRVPWETSITEVFDKIEEHRILHNIPMGGGWKDEVIHQLAMTLKVDNPDDWIEDTEKPYVSWLTRHGRALWAELHDYAASYPEHPSQHDIAEALKWFAGWEARIPSAKCECAYKWKRVASAPDLSSRSRFYGWSVHMHDLIRGTLNQPRMEGEFRHRVQ